MRNIACACVVLLVLLVAGDVRAGAGVDPRKVVEAAWQNVVREADGLHDVVVERVTHEVPDAEARSPMMMRQERRLGHGYRVTQVFLLPPGGGETHMVTHAWVPPMALTVSDDPRRRAEPRIGTFGRVPLGDPFPASDRAGAVAAGIAGSDGFGLHLIARPRLADPGPEELAEFTLEHLGVEEAEGGPLHVIAFSREEPDGLVDGTLRVYDGASRYPWALVRMEREWRAPAGHASELRRVRQQLSVVRHEMVGEVPVFVEAVYERRATASQREGLPVFGRRAEREVDYLERVEARRDMDALRLGVDHHAELPQPMTLFPAGVPMIHHDDIDSTRPTHVWDGEAIVPAG